MRATSRTSKRAVAKTAAAYTDSRQLSLELVAPAVPDLDAVGPSEAAQVQATTSELRLSLSKVVWTLNLRPEGAARAWPPGAALAVGCPAVPSAPTLAKAASPARGASVEYGFNSPELREYFLSGDAELAGVLHLKRAGDKWKASMCKGLLPYVLTADAVAKGAMPPPGRSALPASLERVVPAKYAYWTADDPATAEAMRNALVDSGMFEERLIKVVDGAMRLCIEQLFLYEPDAEADPTPVTATKAMGLGDAIMAAMPEAVRKLAVLAPLSEEGQWPSALHAEYAEPVCLALSAPDAETFDSVVTELSKAAVGIGAHWVVEYDDSPAARAAMWKIGRPFTIDAPAAAGHLFVASFDVASPLVKWADAPAAPDSTELKKRALRIAKTEKDDDERFVLGIVLEPEVVDAQSDIYSQQEIRKTAHKFMEQYRTIGLMHKGAVNDKVKILESYIAPADFEVDGQMVKAGTWLLAVRVQDDELWKSCKAGELTGFSIGGSAIRRPEGSTPAA